MLKRVDTSGDGQVSYEEFYQLFQTFKSQTALRAKATTSEEL
jgi:Ca2+-binding EF-hand superfamily protein